jgi:hypothetical protein
MPRLILAAQGGHDQGQSLTGGGDLDPSRGAILEEPNALIGERRLLAPVQDLEHAGDLVQGGGQDGRRQLIR